jgi:hypothetical protein
MLTWRCVVPTNGRNSADRRRASASASSLPSFLSPLKTYFRLTKRRYYCCSALYSSLDPNTRDREWAMSLKRAQVRSPTTRQKSILHSPTQPGHSARFQTTLAWEPNPAQRVSIQCGTAAAPRSTVFASIVLFGIERLKR